MLINSILRILAFVMVIFYAPQLVQAIESKMSMPNLARLVVEHYLTHKKLDVRVYSLNNSSKSKILGVFVTIYNSKMQTKGCWGNLYPSQDINKSIETAAVGAVKNDYRQKPITLNQLKDAKFQVTIVRNIVQVRSYREVSPVSNGMMLQSGSKIGIILPGEAVDSYYQMVMCKLKAGISDNERYKIYKLVTNTYRE